MKNEQQEFYIGWQDQAPLGVKRYLKVFIISIAALSLIAGLLIVRAQRGFSTSTFELGRITTVEGILLDKPLPFLQVYRGQNPKGDPIYQHIVLVGAGKHGAHEAILAAEKKAGKKLDGQMLRLSGSLIYHDGQTLLETTKGPDGIELVSNPGWPNPPAEITLEKASVNGEIIDPKCFFGAMKPGYGKTHRACAIRCISGGIPPVLKTRAENGDTRYYLLVGQHGEPINDEVLPFVADQVSISGELRQLGDWTILYKTQGTPITRVP